MRLLSLRDLCDNFANRKYKDVTYSLIEDTLQIKEDEVLTWVKMAKHAGLLRCSISRKYKFITPSWCSDRPSDLSKWPLIRLKGIDWIEKYPELGKEVTHQKNRACYAHGCAKGVGLLYRKEHGSLEEWIPARQEIIDRVCKAFPKAGNKNDFRDDDRTKTIPISYTHCLDLIIKHGVGFEKDYPYVVNRNLNKSFPPGKEEYFRIFIKGYEWLGSVYDGVGDKSMLNIFKGGHKCILIANITITSTFLDLKTEFYDHTIVVDPLIEKQRLREGMMSNEISSEDLVHTVVIVAFDVTLRRVKILNSWGSEWGVDGKAWVNINQLYDITRVYSSSLVTECPKPKDRSSTLNYNLRSMDTRKKATSSCKVGMLGASEEIFTAQSCQATAGNGGRRMQFAREPEEFVKPLQAAKGAAADAFVNHIHNSRQIEFQEFDALDNDANSTVEEKRLNRAIDINVLDYWSTNQGRFPNLALMARDVLTVPISTVASESAFSVGGRVLDQYRSCLAHNIVESLICTRDWKFNEEVCHNYTLEELTQDITRLEIIADEEPAHCQ